MSGAATLTTEGAVDAVSSSPPSLGSLSLPAFGSASLGQATAVRLGVCGGCSDGEWGFAQLAAYDYSRCDACVRRRMGKGNDADVVVRFGDAVRVIRATFAKEGKRRKVKCSVDVVGAIEQPGIVSANFLGCDDVVVGCLDGSLMRFEASSASHLSFSKSMKRRRVGCHQTLCCAAAAPDASVMVCVGLLSGIASLCEVAAENENETMAPIAPPRRSRPTCAIVAPTHDGKRKACIAGYADGSVVQFGITVPPNELGSGGVVIAHLQEPVSRLASAGNGACTVAVGVNGSFAALCEGVAVSLSNRIQGPVEGCCVVDMRPNATIGCFVLVHCSQGRLYATALRSGLDARSVAISAGGIAVRVVHLHEDWIGVLLSSGTFRCARIHFRKLFSSRDSTDDVEEKVGDAPTPASARECLLELSQWCEREQTLLCAQAESRARMRRAGAIWSLLLQQSRARDACSAAFFADRSAAISSSESSAVPFLHDMLDGRGRVRVALSSGITSCVCQAQERRAFWTIQVRAEYAVLAYRLPQDCKEKDRPCASKTHSIPLVCKSGRDWRVDVPLAVPSEGPIDLSVHLYLHFGDASSGGNEQSSAQGVCMQLLATTLDVFDFSAPVSECGTFMATGLHGGRLTSAETVDSIVGNFTKSADANPISQRDGCLPLSYTISAPRESDANPLDLHKSLMTCYGRRDPLSPQTLERGHSPDGALSEFCTPSHAKSAFKVVAASASCFSIDVRSESARDALALRHALMARLRVVHTAARTLAFESKGADEEMEIDIDSEPEQASRWFLASSDVKAAAKADLKGALEAFVKIR